MLRTTIVALVASLTGALVHAAQAPQTGSASADKPKPAAAVLEAEGGKFALANVSAPAVEIPLTVENVSDPAKTLKELSIDLSPFTAPTEAAITATIKPTQVAELAPRARAVFTLKATFLPAGTFTSQARLLEGRNPIATFRIEVVRAKGKPPIDVGDVAAVQHTTWPPHNPLDIPLTFTVYATGVSAVVAPPILHSVLRKPKVDSAAGLATLATLDVSALANPLTIKAGEPEGITVTLKGLTAPGRYDAKLRFASAGYEMIDKDVTVYVRDSGRIAFVVILMGVLVSLLFQAYGGSIRPRLVFQRRVESVLASLWMLETSPSLSRAAKEQVADVVKSIKEQWNASGRLGQILSLKVDAYEQIVPAVTLWADRRTSVEKVRPDSVQRKLVTALDDAALPFRAAPPDVTKIAESMDTLRKFPRTIRTEVAKELRTQLDALEAELMVSQNAGAAQLRTSLLLVRDKVIREDVDAAVGAFDLLQLQYVKLLADDLLGRIQIADPPIGIEQPDWQVLVEEMRQAVDRIKAESDAGTALDLATRAVRTFLINLIQALRVATGKLTTGDKATQIIKTLNTADKALSENKLSAAWTHVATATEAYGKARTPAPAGRTIGAVDALAAGGLFESGAFGMMSIFNMAGGSDLESAGAAAQTSARLTWFDIAASVVALLLAVLIGLQTLWIDNLVWGGAPAYLAAFVWGFAVDQLTHAGIAGLRK